MSTTNQTECHCCGRDTIVSGYILRVTNTRGDTLFNSKCIVSCIEFMEKSGLTLQGYRVEVMTYEE